jgi:hypothetical protein
MQYRKLPVRKLKVCKQYQRELNETMVKKIVKDFEDDAFGVLVIGARDDGSHYVVDGQTRLAAAKELGKKEVPCVWFRSEGKDQEAKMFRLVNNHRSVSRLQRTYAMLAEKDPEIVKMDRTVRKHGFKIGYRCSTRTWGNILAVAPLQTMSREGTLDNALAVISEAWEGEVEAVSAAVLSGFQVFLRDYSEKIDFKRLVERLATTSAAKVRAGGDARRLDGGSRGSAISDVMRIIYNRSLQRSSRLK